VITIRVRDSTADTPADTQGSGLARVIDFPQRAAAKAAMLLPNKVTIGQRRVAGWVGIGATATLCLPFLLMLLPLLGFLLVPLLPLIGISWAISLSALPSAPNDRPRAPSASASSRTMDLAHAA
jgi:hypothetical protein